MFKRVLLAVGLMLATASTAFAMGHGGAPADATWYQLVFYELDHHFLHMSFTADAVKMTIMAPLSLESSVAWAVATDPGCTSLGITSPYLFGNVPMALVSFFGTISPADVPCLCDLHPCLCGSQADDDDDAPACLRDLTSQEVSRQWGLRFCVAPVFNSNKMNTQEIKTLGTSLEGWDYKKTNDPRIFDGYHVEGLTSKQYLHKSDANISMGIFYLHGKELYRAWGFLNETCCSYHAIQTPSGISEIIIGCADAHVSLVDGNTATFSLCVLGQTISYPITLLLQKQSFPIVGLTCNNCVAHVTELLQKDASQENVVVSLEEKTLYFDSAHTITPTYLNTLLEGTKYSVIQMHIVKESKIKGIQKFLPLITMFGLVLLFTLFHQYLYAFHSHIFMQYFMAGFFLLFGGLKVLNWKKFVPSYRAYDLIAQKSAVYAWIYPSLEFGLGVVYYIGAASIFVHVFVSVLMLQKAHSVYVKIKSGNTVQCACLGGFFNIPITWVTFSEDLLMAAMAVWMLVG